MSLRSALVAALFAPAAFAGSQFGEPQQKLTGFYAQIDAGAFHGLGGSRGTSNAEPYVGFALGYDITRSFALYGAVAHGSSASNCYMVVVQDTCVENPTNRKAVADNFSFTFMELGLAYTFDLGVRFGLAVRALGGAVILSPLPRPELKPFGGSAGGGLGVEYATRYDGMTIGFDALGRFVLPANIVTLSYSARFKYVF